ncbi:hypothetical protein HZH68_015850 [Vespula germanica]|uniref:G-protein coupled receptors family 3 profile domain-containing protein n=1 Tax=Vespula germanica TaxID=30212 RepID=A0A834MQH1_VESGE|nr:hypothetical protein HZH68_015850 [Vespula germanica]
MLKLFSVPQISYMATSPALSNKKIYPHFFRTIPSDLNQAHAMLEILKQFEWTYVSIVYSDTEYGNHGYETLTSLAYLYSICFSTPQRINKEHFKNEDYDTVIRTIANKTDVRVVVLFAEKSTTLRVLDAAKRLNVGTRFLWIGSDSWSSSNHRDFADLDSSRMGQEMAVLEGALVVQPLSRQLSGFDKYFTNLTLEHEKINPWFREFWQEYHRCGINDTEVMIREEQDLCCWRCRKCGLYQYKVNDQRCEDCLLGTRPTKDSKRCDSIPEEYIDYYSPWAIVAMVVASIGILLTIYVWFIFRIYGETPVIKASGRELSSLLLLSILASFLMTFAIVAEPITETCAITRFGIGFCYTLCYAALVTKTNRIHRIFNNISHSPRKSRYTSPKSQLLITGILILLEVIVNVILLIMVPPRVKHIYPTRDTKIKICQGLDDRSYIVSLIYPFVLIGHEKEKEYEEEKEEEEEEVKEEEEEQVKEGRRIEIEEKEKEEEDPEE